MKISFIGTGRMARNLGQGWQKAGHEIVFGSREPGTKADLLDGATVYTIGLALESPEVVVIAIPFTAVEPFARQYADQLRGKLVVDITNPFGNLPDNRISGAEITADAIGPGARVVAAFKSNFWETLLEPIDLETGIVRDVLFAADDTGDKEIAARLISDLGFRAVDCGPLRNARVLDGMVPLIIELDRRYAEGARRLYWKLLG